MCRLAAVGLGHWLDVLGPLPSGLEGRPADAAALQVDQLELARTSLERPGLLG